MKNHERDEYIVKEREKGRTYASTGHETGVSATRARQICEKAYREKRMQYFRTHPGAFEEWVNSMMMGK